MSALQDFKTHILFLFCWWIFNNALYDWFVQEEEVGAADLADEVSQGV